MMAHDYPQIVDKSTLTGVFLVDQFLTVGVEGQMDAVGTAVVGLPVLVTTAEQASGLFGANSSLTKLVNVLLGRGLAGVWAVASASGVAPTLVQRQTAWAALEENSDVRVRLTDSVTQADLVALADSCENAETIQHKQFCVVGLSTPSTKDGATAVGDAIASKRAVLVSPGIYDNNGNLLTGQYGAAYAAAEVAKNPDIADSLNLMSLGATGGIETQNTTGLPLYRLHANAGVPINDFQDLLDHGVSPFQQGRDGRAAFTHLRTTYTVDETFDALMTLLIKDQVFLDIRDLLLASNTLRTGNTADNRSLAAKMVESYLTQHSDWVQPVELANGTVGYGVSVTPTPDSKSMTINYHGQVVRGTNVININGSLTIPV
jgi:hypothetical protein